ncbi:MAG: hypothetical protein Q8J74_14870 [Candidatus Didemnitutus sp.]|nr:hypothetical protein [Candidatus Didemnitutus sp.]
MSRFYHAQADREFFLPSFSGNRIKDEGFVAVGASKPDFLCNLAYGDDAKRHHCGPRLDLAKPFSSSRRPRPDATNPLNL